MPAQIDHPPTTTIRTTSLAINLRPIKSWHVSIQTFHSVATRVPCYVPDFLFGQEAHPGRFHKQDIGSNGLIGSVLPSESPRAHLWTISSSPCLSGYPRLQLRSRSDLVERRRKRPEHRSQLESWWPAKSSRSERACPAF